MLRKGTPTKEIQFIQLKKDKNDNITETELYKVSYDKIENNNYSWNYKEYCHTTQFKYGDLEYKKLGDICDINIGKTPSMSKPEYYENGENLWVQISDMESKYIYDTQKKITTDAIKNYSIRKIKKGSILLSFKSNIGKVCISGNDMYCHEAIAFFTGDNNILTEYLFYYFYVFDISQQKNGCHENSSLNKDSLKSLQIPIPPLEVQNLIIKELDSLYEQQKLLSDAINVTNTYKKTKFDLLLLECENVQKVKLGDVIKVSPGEYITKDSITGNYSIYGDKSGLTNKFNRENQFIIAKDDISETCVRYVCGKFFLNQHGWTYDVVKENILNNFIGYYLISIQHEIYKLAFGTAQKINYEKFYDISIKLPSLEDQQKIIDQMESHDKLMELQQKQIDEIDGFIKKRMDYHLKKCQHEEANNESHDEPYIELSENKLKNKITEEPIKKVIKKVSVKKVIKRQIHDE